MIAEIDGLQIRRIKRVPVHDLLETSINNDFYEVRWEKVSRTKSKSVLNGKWLLLADSGGVGEDLAHRIHELGTDYLIIKQGNEYKQLDKNKWQIDPSQPGHFERLLVESTSNGNEPLRGIVHLWSLDNPFDSSIKEGDIEAHLLDDAEKQILNGTLNLLRFMDGKLSTPVRLWLVTRGARFLDCDQRPPSLAQSSLWGLGRTIAQEHPEWQCSCIDLDLSDPGINTLHLLDEISSEDDETQVALRGNERFVARLDHYHPETKTSISSFAGAV